MPPLDPRLDFRDDGGTPMWRSRQAAVILDARRPGFLAAVNRVPAWHLAAFVGIWCLLGVPAYALGALILAAAMGLPDHLGWIPGALWGAIMAACFVSAVRRLLYSSRSGR